MNMSCEKISSNNPYVFMFKHMWKHAPNKKLLLSMLSFSGISKLLWLIEPWVFGKLINLIQTQWISSRHLIWKILLWLMFIHFFAWIFHGKSRVWEESIKFQVAEEYIATMFHKVSSLSMQWHMDNHTGKTIDKINKAMYALRWFSGSNFMYISTIFFSLWSIISLLIIRWPAAIILFLFASLSFFIVRKFDVYIVPLIKQKNTKEHEVMSTLFDFLSNIKTVVTLRFESQALKTVRKKIKSVFPVFEKYSIYNERKWFSMDMIMKGVSIIVVWYYVYNTFQSNSIVLIGTMTMLYQYIEKMSTAFSNFTWQWSGLVTNKADMEAVSDIEEAYASLTKEYSVILQDWNHIVIHSLNFTYQDSQKHQHTLKNIILDIQKNKKIALVGESGSGKSTLLSLLRWLYDVDNVSLQVDWQLYQTLHPLAHTTSLIPQEPEIFEQTIRYNLSMWLDVKEEQFWKFLYIACMDTVIRALPEWLDADVKEKWVNLSGGQKQRLALARGLLMSQWSDIILLDEPTSSVDSVNEVLIHQRMFETMYDKTIICSIHKLHLLDMFEEIYVLHEWILVEKWSLSSLKSHKGVLWKMLEEYKVESY